MRHYTRRLISLKGIFILIGFSLIFSALAGEAWTAGSKLAISGEIRKDFAYSLGNGELITNSASYRLSIGQDFGEGGRSLPGGFELSLRGEYDFNEGLGTLAELDQAYVDLYLEGADLRLGQQNVNWGVAYGVNPTSYVNPPRMPDDTGASGSIELTGLPVPAVSATFYPSWGDVGVVAVVDPRFRDVPIPKDKQLGLLEALRYRTAQETGMSVSLAGTSFSAPVPESLSDRLEFAGRAGTRYKNWDIYVSGFRGWEDHPVIWVGSQVKVDSWGNPYIELSPNARYRKVTKGGIAASSTFGPYTLWGELAYAWPERVRELEQDTGNISFSSNRPYVQAVLGGDRSFGDENDLYTCLEYVYNGSGSLLSPYWLSGGEPQARHYLIGIARYTPADAHEFELSSVYCLSDGSAVAIPRYTYRITSSISLWLASSVFGGGAGSEFGSLRSQRAVMTGLKLAF